MFDLPIYLWVLALTGVIGIPATTCVMLYCGAIAIGLSRRRAGVIVAATAAALGGWIVLSGLLAYVGAYRQEPGRAIPWLPVLAAASLVVLLLAARIPVISRILSDSRTLMRLTLPHTLRVVGVLFLIVMARDQLPALFALPAGLGDIATGLAAPIVYRRLAQGDGRADALWFNLFGIFDLVVAASIGFLLLGFVAVTPSTAPLLLLPLALIPTVPVPLAAVLHILSLRRLSATAQIEDDRVGRPLSAVGD